jgi:hypothetical protein
MAQQRHFVAIRGSMGNDLGCHVSTAAYLGVLTCIQLTAVCHGLLWNDTVPR